MQLGTAGRRRAGGSVSAPRGYCEHSRGTPSTHRGALSTHPPWLAARHAGRRRARFAASDGDAAARAADRQAEVGEYSEYPCQCSSPRCECSESPL
jgi:hypothetical protein